MIKTLKEKGLCKKDYKNSKDKKNQKKSILFEEKKIQDLDKHGLIKSELSVIDFDQTKEIVVYNMKKSGYKSTDALYIDVQNESMIFIEIKTTEHFIKDLKKRELTPKEKAKEIQDWVKDKKFEKKICDSLLILNPELINSSYLQLSDKEKKMYQNIYKEYYLILDDDEIISNSPKFGVSVNGFITKLNKLAYVKPIKDLLADEIHRAIKEIKTQGKCICELSKIDILSIETLEKRILNDYN